MAPKDPRIRAAAVAALRKAMEANNGEAPWHVLRQIASTYDVDVSTAYRWATSILEGKDVGCVNRSGPGASRLTDEILALIAHYPTLEGAHSAAVSQGIYEQSYRTFLRDVNRLSPAVREGLRTGKDGMVKHLPTMSYPLVSRNETWALDHTRSDVRVVAPRGNRMLRPWVSILKDKGTRTVVSVVVTAEPTNAEKVIAMVAAGMLGEGGTAPGADVGGRPESILVDNGAENTSQALVRGCAMLGIAVLTTTPGHSWQNGAAENVIRLYQRLEATLPGYVHGGEALDGGLRFTENTYAKENPDALLTLEALQQRATEWAIAYNTTPGSDGATPLELWAADTAEIDTVSADEVRFAMTTEDRCHAATKNGLRFRRHDYQGACLLPYVGRGTVLTVRHLPSVTDWIDVYDGPTYVGRLTRKELLPKAEQSGIIRARQSVASTLRRADAASMRQRQQEAAGDTAQTPVSAEERRSPHKPTAPAAPRTYGGGARSAREAGEMAKRRDLALERFADQIPDITRPDEEPS